MLVPQVRSDRDKFTVYLDVKHFSPDELSVKMTDDYVEIQGKHGERQVTLVFSVLTASLTKSTKTTSSFLVVLKLLDTNIDSK